MDSGNVNGSGQAKVASTGTAQALPQANASNGFILTAKASNAAPISIGAPGVNNTVDGTGTGYILEAGNSIFIQILALAQLAINGTAGDVLSFIGC